MTTARQACNRRQFFGIVATAAAFGQLPWVWAGGQHAKPKRRRHVSARTRVGNAEPIG